MNVEQIISAEHRALTKAMDYFEPLCRDLSSWKLFFDFCTEYLEKNHHEKEEKLIFSAIRSDPRIRMGGPLCTLYFDQYLQAPAIARSQKVIKDIINELKIKLPDRSNPDEFIQQFINPQWSADFSSDLINNSPLLIPAGDHVSGRMLLHFVQFLLSLAGSSMDGKIHFGSDVSINADITFKKLEHPFKTIFFHYREIQVDHFVREEKCFLKMCQSLISAEDWSKIATEILNQYPLITDELLLKHFAASQ